MPINKNSNTSQLNSRQDKTRWNMNSLVAYTDNDNDNDDPYSMYSDGIKIIS